MKRLEYPLDRDHKWSDLKLVSEPAFAVLVPFNDGYGLTVTTDSATGITSRKAILNGTLDDDGGFADVFCGFEWGETDAYGNTTPTEKKVTGETFSQVITGLSPGTTYHFRALADNKGTAYGSDQTFTTKKTQGNPNIDQLIYQHVERMQR